MLTHPQTPSPPCPSLPSVTPPSPPTPGSVGRIIALIAAIPTPLPSREALSARLKPHASPEAVALWLGSSLVPRDPPSGGGGSGGQELVWAFDIQGAAALYHSYR